jgi:hypothetical protein
VPSARARPRAAQRRLTHKAGAGFATRSRCQRRAQPGPERTQRPSTEGRRVRFVRTTAPLCARGFARRRSGRGRLRKIHNLARCPEKCASGVRTTTTLRGRRDCSSAATLQDSNTPALRARGLVPCGERPKRSLVRPSGAGRQRHEEEKGISNRQMNLPATVVRPPGGRQESRTCAAVRRGGPL